MCKESELVTRGGDNDAICSAIEAISLATECGRTSFGLGAIVGAVVGYVIGGPIGAAIGAITGVGVVRLTNIGGCPGIDCDDCHHAEEISIIIDYENCRFSGAEAIGAFEQAKYWEWSVVWSSGSFSAITGIPRISMPQDFDPDSEEFTIRCITYCDGEEIPDNDPDGTIKEFNGLFSPVPWMLLGNSVVDDNGNFRFESSATFGQISYPSWGASANVEIVSTGFDNDVYYAILNFSNVTLGTAEISLTLHDDCAGGNHVRTKTVRLVQI